MIGTDILQLLPDCNWKATEKGPSFVSNDEGTHEDLANATCDIIRTLLKNAKAFVHDLVLDSMKSQYMAFLHQAMSKTAFPHACNTFAVHYSCMGHHMNESHNASHNGSPKLTSTLTPYLPLQHTTLITLLSTHSPSSHQLHAS